MIDMFKSLSVRRIGMLIHVAGWAILFCSPFFFTGNESEITVEDYLRRLLIPISFMFIFYLNYCRFVARYIYNHRIGMFLLVNIAAIISTMLVVHLCMRYILPDPLGGEPHPVRPLNEIIGFFIFNAVTYSLVAALSVAIKMTEGWNRVAAIQLEMEKERAEVELKNLKSQLNPHFLFNTLNNIYSLITLSQERAQDAVYGLSRLLRYVLYESSQPLVPLEKEIAFVTDYIELMRIRLPKNVELKSDISVSSKGETIAPLLFISLVENAFKHGVSNNLHSFIHIKMSMENGHIVCFIENSYFPKRQEQDKSGSGIGLSNLERRLELIYPDRFILKHECEGDIYSSLLSVNLKDVE